MKWDLQAKPRNKRRKTEMAIIFQEWINKQDLRERPDCLFIFGDNEKRYGMGGQAGECRGEPNAVGVATKKLPARTNDAYWSDEDFDRCCEIIDKDLERVFDHVNAGGDVVFPKSGVGTGLSELPTRAPRVMEHIRKRVRELVVISKENER
jgi:hypothetical protein